MRLITSTLLIITFVFSLQAQNVLGIDVSHHQGDINWTMVANDGKVFAFVKATEGFTYDDPKFTTYMNAGVSAGVVMGAYHFARPDNNSAVDEANHFVSVAGNYIGAGFLPPALDLEDPNANTHLDQLFSPVQLTNWVQTWMDRVEDLTGIKPVIYLNSNYANFLHSSLNNYGLWIAKPGTAPNTPPNDTGNWNDWEFKQYSWTGNVNGISGNVDLDSYHGNATEFNQMLQDIAGVQSNSGTDFRLYPNPGNGQLRLTALSGDNRVEKLEVYSVSGQLLQSMDYPGVSIDLNLQKNGVYFLKITDENGHVFVVKYLLKK